MKNRMVKLFRKTAAPVTAIAAIAAAPAASAQTDASTLVGSFTTAISGNDTHMWTIGAAIASFVAVVAVIGLLIRNSRRVASSS